MTIKEAKKILGKLAIGLNYEQITTDIESANLLKDMFFKIYLDVKHKDEVESINHDKKCTNLY